MKYSLTKTVESCVPVAFVKKQMFAELFSEMKDGDFVCIKSVSFEAKSGISEMPSKDIFSAFIKYGRDGFTEYRLEVFVDSNVFITEKDMESMRMAMISFATLTGDWPSVIHMNGKTIKAIGKYLSETYHPYSTPMREIIYIWGLCVIEDERLPFKEFVIK